MTAPPAPVTRSRPVRAKPSRPPCRSVDRNHVRDDVAGSAVLRKLEQRVDHIVVGMQLLAGVLALLGSLGGTAIGVNGFVPVAYAREDVRRHMQGVRCRRRDLGVALGSVESLPCDRRIVIEMDQVMRDAGMPRLALEDRLQDSGALELVGIGLVVW